LKAVMPLLRATYNVAMAIYVRCLSVYSTSGIASIQALSRL
jgi:hypothetical protein